MIENIVDAIMLIIETMTLDIGIDIIKNIIIYIYIFIGLIYAILSTEYGGLVSPIMFIEITIKTIAYPAIILFNYIANTDDHA